MKLAQALILRADSLKRFRQLKERLFSAVKVQEGDEQPESPQELIKELEVVAKEFTGLVKKINITNYAVKFENGKTILDALVERDVLKLRRQMYEELIEKTKLDLNRYSRSEVKFVVTVNVAKIYRMIENLSKEHRELDSKLQQFNWMTDLIE